MMTRFITIIVFILLVISSFGQAKQGTDGLYYAADGSLFSGTSTEYQADSIVKATIEILDGQLNGLTKIYFDNGHLEEIRSFSTGKMDGKWEKWNRQNIKIAEANYIDNLKDGKWYVWDDNGVLRYDMTYEKGKKAGTWTMYDEKGTLIDTKAY